MKKSYKMLFVATMLVLAGCGEKKTPPEQVEIKAKPHRYIPRAKITPQKVASATVETNVCVQKSEKVTTTNQTAVLKELAAELRNLGDEEKLTADSALQLIEKYLGSTSFTDVFSDLSDLMTSTDTDGRIAALNVLSILKCEWCATEVNTEEVENVDPATESIPKETEEISKVTEETSDENVDTDSNQESNSLESEKDDIEQRAVYAMMTLGLQDENASVRDAAYETLLTLPNEERSALSLQLMGNDDVALKERLLTSCAGDDSDFARNVSFHGLDATELSVRNLAENNVKQLTGQTFTSSDEAFSWYEQQISVGE